MLKIVHASDIQIRTFKRHQEFRNHFNNFYTSVKQQNPDLIVLAGDIIHQKSNISPELVEMCVDFFRNLSNIAPIHFIAGNHDAVLSNLSRLDSLSPIIKALNNDKIYYYKHSGIYSVNNDFDFVVYSCLDDESCWPLKNEINKEKINIGLFHGMINGAILQNGQEVQDSPYKLNDFLDKVDYLMLGDIHKKQILDMNYRAAYCGSLIQQNYGESLEKGYLLWTIEDKKEHNVDFVRLPNVCPYYTLELQDDLIVPNVDFQKKARIRVFSKPITMFEKKTLSDKINEICEPVELVFLDDQNIQRQEIKIYSGEKVENIGDIFVQEKLIREFLKSKNLSEEFLQKIFEINKVYNAQIRVEDETFKNIQYKLKKMSFHNMFSYGENNEFDFDKYKGIVGIFGKSATGKSSLVVDIPLYCMVNKVSKKGVVRNDLIINENKEDCAVEMDIAAGNNLGVY